GDEADARVDPRVRKRDVEPTVDVCRLVDHAVERGVVGHVGNRAAHLDALACEPRDLPFESRRVDVDQRDPGAVRAEHLAVREPEATRPAGHDDAVACDVEAGRDVHRASTRTTAFITSAGCSIAYAIASGARSRPNSCVTSAAATSRRRPTSSTAAANSSAPQQLTPSTSISFSGRSPTRTGA